MLKGKTVVLGVTGGIAAYKSAALTSLLVKAGDAFGIANMWLAVFADVGVAVLAILNAMRALYVKDME